MEHNVKQPTGDMVFDHDDPLDQASYKQSQHIYPSQNEQGKTTDDSNNNGDGLPSH